MLCPLIKCTHFRVKQNLLVHHMSFSWKRPVITVHLRCVPINRTMSPCENPVILLQDFVRDKMTDIAPQKVLIAVPPVVIPFDVFSQSFSECRSDIAELIRLADSVGHAIDFRKAVAEIPERNLYLFDIRRTGKLFFDIRKQIEINAFILPTGSQPCRKKHRCFSKPDAQKCNTFHKNLLRISI